MTCCAFLKYFGSVKSVDRDILLGQQKAINNGVWNVVVYKEHARVFDSVLINVMTAVSIGIQLRKCQIK